MPPDSAFLGASREAGRPSRPRGAQPGRPRAAAMAGAAWRRSRPTGRGRPRNPADATCRPRDGGAAGCGGHGADQGRSFRNVLRMWRERSRVSPSPRAGKVQAMALGCAVWPSASMTHDGPRGGLAPSTPRQRRPSSLTSSRGFGPSWLLRPAEGGSPVEGLPPARPRRHDGPVRASLRRTKAARGQVPSPSPPMPFSLGLRHPASGGRRARGSRDRPRRPGGRPARSREPGPFRPGAQGGASQRWAAPERWAAPGGTRGPPEG